MAPWPFRYGRNPPTTDGSGLSADDAARHSISWIGGAGIGDRDACEAIWTPRLPGLLGFAARRFASHNRGGPVEYILGCPQGHTGTLQTVPPEAPASVDSRPGTISSEGSDEASPRCAPNESISYQAGVLSSVAVAQGMDAYECPSSPCIDAEVVVVAVAVPRESISFSDSAEGTGAASSAQATGGPRDSDEGREAAALSGTNQAQPRLRRGERDGSAAASFCEDLSSQEGPHNSRSYRCKQGGDVQVP
jgi:hypothetical protein